MSQTQGGTQGPRSVDDLIREVNQEMETRQLDMSSAVREVYQRSGGTEGLDDNAIIDLLAEGLMRRVEQQGGQPTQGGQPA